jgi:thioredoxin-like negative regulator of GroEL
LAWTQQAEGLVRAGLLAEAEEVLAAGLEVHPDNHEIMVALAQAASRQGRHDEALARWTRAFDTFPDSWQASVGLASARLACEQVEEAMNEFAAAAQRFPDEPSPLIEWAEANYALDRLDDAERLFGGVLERFPDRPEGYAGLARVCISNGAAAAAIGLIATARERFPDNWLVARESAAVAEALDDWPLAVARWRAAAMQFPEIEELRRRLFEAEMRQVERDTDRKDGTDASARGAEADAELDADQRLALRFESFGGTLHGCEFGLVQRACRVEPLGLLRWCEMAPENLIDALNNNFAGVGEPENTILAIEETDEGPEYFTRDRRFLMSMHTFVRTDEQPADRFFAQSCRRIRYLAEKMIEDLTAGEKIFVYKNTNRDLTETEIGEIRRAMSRYGRNMLLYVRYAGEEHPNGTVEWVEDGLMYGYLDRFIVARSGEYIGPVTESWVAICRAASALRDAGGMRRELGPARYATVRLARGAPP